MQIAKTQDEGLPLQLLNCTLDALFCFYFKRNKQTNKNPKNCTLIQSNGPFQTRLITACESPSVPDTIDFSCHSIVAALQHWQQLNNGVSTVASLGFENVRIRSVGMASAAVKPRRYTIQFQHMNYASNRPNATHSKANRVKRKCFCISFICFEALRMKSPLMCVRQQNRSSSCTSGR